MEDRDRRIGIGSRESRDTIREDAKEEEQQGKAVIIWGFGLLSPQALLFILLIIRSHHLVGGGGDEVGIGANRASSGIGIRTRTRRLEIENPKPQNFNCKIKACRSQVATLASRNAPITSAQTRERQEDEGEKSKGQIDKKG